MVEARFTIQEVAERVGRRPWTLRQLENRKILPPARRDYNGWRYYTEADVEMVLSILYPPQRDEAS